MNSLNSYVNEPLWISIPFDDYELFESIIAFQPKYTTPLFVFMTSKMIKLGILCLLFIPGPFFWSFQMHQENENIYASLQYVGTLE